MPRVTATTTVEAFTYEGQQDDPSLRAWAFEAERAFDEDTFQDHGVTYYTRAVKEGDAWLLSVEGYGPLHTYQHVTKVEVGTTVRFVALDSGGPRFTILQGDQWETVPR